MSYHEALQAAGATVLAYERFGSYQGEWLAKVVYQGETFYVQGAYGSCSGCDVFEATFYGEGECDEHRYNHDGTEKVCLVCKSGREEYQKQLVVFGLSYLTDPFTKDQLVKQFSKQSGWDHDAEDVLKWLEAN